MKIIILSFFLFSTIPLLAQEKHALSEWNDEVWKPFMLSYNAYDIESFLALHAEQSARVPADQGVIFGKDLYRSKLEENKIWAEKFHRSRNLELRFTDRYGDGEWGVERGIYKLTTTQPGKEQGFYYGAFFVLVRKIDGRWKIWMDMDENPDGSIGEDLFLMASPLEEIDRWMEKEKK